MEYYNKFSVQQLNGIYFDLDMLSFELKNKCGLNMDDLRYKSLIVKKRNIKRIINKKIKESVK